MKRKGGVPPIVTVLVTIASIVSAGLVAWFLWTSTRSATQTPVLDVTAAYITGTGDRIKILVRNLGPDLASLSITRVNCTGGPRSTNINPSSVSSFGSGTSTVFEVVLSSSISDGASCTANFQATIGTATVTLDEAFKVTKP